MNCTRCNHYNPPGSSRCTRCGLVFPPTPTAPAPAVTAVTPPPTVAPTTATITPPAATGATPALGLAGVPTPAPDPNAETLKERNERRWGYAFIGLASSLITIWFLGGIFAGIHFLQSIPAVGVLYFIPIEVQSAKWARHGFAVFWVLLWAGIHFGK